MDGRVGFCNGLLEEDRMCVFNAVRVVVVLGRCVYMQERILKYRGTRLKSNFLSEFRVDFYGWKCW